MAQLIDIFLEPAKLWSQQRERPTFLVPALLVAVATVLSTALYFFNVDPQWFTEHQIQAMGQEMSASEIEKMKGVMPGARTQGLIAAVSTPIVLAIVFAITALYYLLAGKVAGHAVSYRHGLSLAAWAAMPMLVGALVSIIGIFTSSPQTSYESLQLLSVDPLLVQLPMDHDWSRLAKSFSLLNLWGWFLAALGWKTWFRTEWGQAIVVAVLPGVVIYGVMALFALL